MGWNSFAGVVKADFDRWCGENLDAQRKIQNMLDACGVSEKDFI